MQIYSFSPFGYEGSLVTVEIDLRRGIPAIDIVGLADGAVKESRERMQAAIRNSGFDFPGERVLISLSPADLKKEGAGFDLAIALGVLAQSDMDGNKDSDSILVMGELELSGKIRNVRGIHAACENAFSCGINRCIVPAGNAEEAREVKGMKVFGADSLENAFLALKNPECFTENCNPSDEDEIYCKMNAVRVGNVWFPKIEDGMDFDEMTGQKQLIRGLQVAACGGHNLMAVGSPGCGKTMAIQKFPGLLPLLTNEEAQSTTRIMSLAGLLPAATSIVRVPPFRMPHQTASIEGICGGGPQCRPGEISLAHNGVLFLDEAAEFRTSVLQMLRVPVENGRITVSRAGRSTIFPADFQLLMAANPCPCGNYGSNTKICLCSARSVELYWKKFSAPLLDRIDIRIPIDNENSFINSNLYDREETDDSIIKNARNSMPAGNPEPENNESAGKFRTTTEELRKAIATGIEAQRKRQGCKNAKLSPSELHEYCKMDKECEQILNDAAIRYSFSPRGVSSCLKLSRTIADMDGRENLEPADIREAIGFRQNLNSMCE